MSLLRRWAGALSRRVPKFRGKRRLTRWIDSFLPGRSKPTRVTVDGVTYSVRSDDIIEHCVLFDGVYERDVLEVCNKIIRASDGGVLWDVGAHVGTVALPLVHEHPGLRAVCFEPSPAVASKLLANRRLNPSLAPRIEVVVGCLVEESTFCAFYPSAEDHNTGVGGLADAHNTRDRPVFMGGFSGDWLVADTDLPEPTILKIDVEGFEYEVLSGLPRTLTSEALAAVVFEMTKYRYEARGSWGTEVLELLRKYGYELFSINDGAVLEPLAADEEGVWGDFLAIDESLSLSSALGL